MTSAQSLEPTRRGLSISRLETGLLRLVDFGLLSMIFIAPLFMGGRHVVGKLAFVSIASITTVLWLTYQCLPRAPRWRRCGAEWLLVAGLLLIILQLSPLPQALLSGLAPSLEELLPSWTARADAPSSLGTWSQISVAPSNTRAALAVFLAYGMVFLVAFQRMYEREDVERMVRWVALAAVGMAALGVIQLVIGNGKFLWFYDHPFRDTDSAARGTFANPNHFAHFLALGIGPLIWWFHSIQDSGQSSRSKRRDRRQKARRGGFSSDEQGPIVSQSRLQGLLAAGMGIVAFAGLLSFSRGGLVAIFLATAICTGLYVRQAILGRKSVLALGGAGVVVVAAVLIYGYQPLVKELESVGVGSVDELSQSLNRLQIWGADWKAVQDSPLVGFGAGSHREVYPIYLDQPAEVEYTHAESGYLQVLLETGLAGLVLLVLGVGICLWWSLGALRRADSPRTAACAGALLASLAVSAAHSILDFVWYIPACMTLTLILAAASCRLYQMAREKEEPSRSSEGVTPSPVTRGVLRGALALAGAALATVMIGDRLPAARAAGPWERYLALSQAESAGLQPEQIEPGEVDAAMLEHLEAAAAANPWDARIQVRLATIYLRQFDVAQQSSPNPMNLAQIREAALASQFPSRQALDEWLSRAVGPHRGLLGQSLQAARRAVRLCPLQGQGYVYLSELCFLEGADPGDKSAHVSQALKVRPHDGQVLVAAGAEAVLAGKTAEAFDLWKRAFRQGPEHQARIVELLGPSVPAEVFLEEFQPELSGLRLLFTSYSKWGRRDEATRIGTIYAAMLREQAEGQAGSAAAATWKQATAVYRAMGDRPQAIECAKRALRAWPNDYKIHSDLGVLCLEEHQFDEAVVHLRWCLRRTPNSLEIQDRLRAAIKGANDGTISRMDPPDEEGVTVR